METVEIKIKKLSPDVELPAYATPGSSGVDIRSNENRMIAPGEVYAISTGICVEIPLGYEIQVRPRSGLSIKKSISVNNSPGTIDSDYRGEIKVILINHSKNSSFSVNKGDRIAQLVCVPVYRMTFIEDGLSNTDRGTGGFGSTGI
jgi:dUTP pyrophosphatase